MDFTRNITTVQSLSLVLALSEVYHVLITHPKNYYSVTDLKACAASNYKGRSVAEVWFSLVLTPFFEN